MKNLKMITVIVISILALIVVLQNTQSVETKILFATITIPRAFLLFLVFLFGLIAGGILTVTVSHKKKVNKN